MNNLHEILEICLQDIEQGADIETVLFRYPEHAQELRPILEASVNAKSMAIPAPSVEVVRRNRTRVLQHAAQLREAKTRSSKRVWFTSLRRVAVTLAVVATLFVSGTRLVGAASTTVPGDNLYPVKRTWEDVLLLFTFNLQQREALEVEHENERLHELRELFAEGRFAEVEFAGQVTSQNGNIWIVSGIPVIISNQTEIRDRGIVISSAVRVKGHAQGDGVVLAERVRLLSSDEKLPDLDDEHESEENNHGNGNGNENEQEDDNSGKGSGDDEPKDEEFESKDESSNSGSGSDNSGSGSGGSDSDSSQDDSDNSNDDGSDDNKDNSGHGSDDSSADSGGGGDGSDSGGGDD
jgi:uncharacterized membrane protein YgcG